MALKAEGVGDFRRARSATSSAYYTREAGVRNLEREIANLARKAIKEIVIRQDARRVRITRHAIYGSNYGGVPRKFRYGQAELTRTRSAWPRRGLAWTEVGGELLLTIEAVMLPGKGKMISPPASSAM